MSISPLRVSIGIPSYNEGRALQNLLDALQHQKLSPCIEIIEVIISDDSSDDTPRLIEKYISRSGHKFTIKLFHREERRGTAVAWNEIMQEAQGDVIILFDADVLLHPKAVEFLAECFFSHHQVGVVASNIIPLKPKTYSGGASYLIGLILQVLRLNPSTTQLTVHSRGLAMRKELATLSPIPSHTIAVDLYLTCRALELNYKVVLAENALVYFRPAETFLEFASQVIRAFIGHHQLQRYTWRFLHERVGLMKQLWVAMKVAKSHPREASALMLAFILLPLNLPRIFRGASTHIWDIAPTSKA